MARWKLSRLTFGNEEFTFLEGEEVTLGRGVNNTITLSSLLVSRNHCKINVEADKVLITDLKSSNGLYVGLKKIAPNTPYSLDDSDIIGIGWTQGAPVANIKDHEKYMFKLTKEKPPPITSRLTFQSDNEGEIELEVTTKDGAHPSTNTLKSPITSSKQTTNKLETNKPVTNKQSTVINTKPAVKRKIELPTPELKNTGSKKYKIDNNIISILSDSDNESPPIEEVASKKPKLEPGSEEPLLIENDIKLEREDLEFDPFKVKQEYYDDGPIQIDSESDDESVQWFMRLSQSSPGKPIIKTTRESKVAKVELEESSYSQMDDDFEDDLIRILPPPEDYRPKSPDSGIGEKSSEQNVGADGDAEDFLEDLISLQKPNEAPPVVEPPINKETNRDVVDGTIAHSSKNLQITAEISVDLKNKSNIVENNSRDEVDSLSTKNLIEILESDSTDAFQSTDKNKKAQMIEPLVQPSKIKSTISTETKHKSSSSSSRHTKDKKHKHHSSSKRHITDSQKEERKKKLKEIATKEKEESAQNSKKRTSKDKIIVNAKVTSSNRGAFLTDVLQGVVKPVKRKESPPKLDRNKEKTNLSAADVTKYASTVINKKESDTSSYNAPAVESKKNEKSKEPDKSSNTSVAKESKDDIENKKKHSEKHNSSRHKEKEKSTKEQKTSKHREKETTSKCKSTNSKPRKSSTESRIPLKSLKPLSESEDSISGKPFSKVEPMPPPKKPKKTVRFSIEPPKVIVFEIEEGNSLKKTSLVKTSLVDVRQKPVFSLEKITLMRILRWNPHWLDEQISNNDPPPILGSNSPPSAILHSFNNHNQYIQVVGDLLLMEIWECLTQGYMRVRSKTNGIQMRIASLPPISSQDRCFELFNLSVNVSVPNSEVKTVPRMGEIILVTFGPENARNKRFFYVHNVRTLQSPPNNRNSFFCISLHTCYTDKMKALKPGELMNGLTLTYIQNELKLFEAMEYLAGSPLSDAILKPEPRHFIKCDPNASYTQSQWTKTLNPSQQRAVHSSVAAALGDRPCIQMVQGPPGTGKSRVICAMVMTYFYDGFGRRQQNRGKLLICATSNAAVDELVIRLLNIRQNLPKSERFRMVRVGRAEAMHPRAHDISSQQLAARDAAARHGEPLQPGLNEEISHLEAKINMWKTQEQDAKDPVRAAYCKSRVKVLQERLSLEEDKLVELCCPKIYDARFPTSPLLRNSPGGGGGAGSTGEPSAEQLMNIERRIIEGADIIVTTLASAHNHKMRGLRRRIALCIIDEAGQAIEPEALIPLTLDVTRLALIGDPQQLPGFICSQRAKKHGLGESLFYRLTSCSEQWGEGSPVILLDQQYRMHAEIADYPNRAFYGSRIRSVPPPRPNIDIPPYSIVCISSGDKGQGASGANEMEAWGVARLVVALYAMLKPLNLSLAVITPYSAHKELIKRNLRLLQEPNEGHIEVNTVDSFQGQERDVVVASLARSQGVGFLTDAGRMNVMLTRARHALLLALNPHAMLKNYQWRTLVEDSQKRNLYRILPQKICQGPSAGQIPNNDVLKYIIQSKPSCK